MNDSRKVSYSQTVTMKDVDRASIEAKASAALGSYIARLDKLDFSTWTPEEWQDFVSIGFDIVAIEMFQHRMMVLPPFVTREGEMPF